MFVRKDKERVMCDLMFVYGPKVSQSQVEIYKSHIDDKSKPSRDFQSLLLERTYKALYWKRDD